MRLTNRIDSLVKRESKLQSQLAGGDLLAGSFPLGVGCMSRGQAKKQGANADRTARLAGQLQQVREDLAFYRARLAGVNAGKCHENGQPRADSPSRKLETSLNLSYGDFIRATVKPGDDVLFVVNDIIVTVARINKKTMSYVGGSNWDFLSYQKLNPDGTKPSLKETSAAFKKWKDEN
jgi:hypothetical protein